MKKIFIIFIIIAIVYLCVFVHISVYLFDRRISNLETELKDGYRLSTSLESNIETINTLAEDFKNVGVELERIENCKIDAINYLCDVMVISNSFLEYSKSIYGYVNDFLKTLKIKGMHPVSIKEITDIENELDKKDRTIYYLTKKYDELSSDYNELYKTIYILTKN